MVNSVVRSVSPGSSRFPGDVSGQKGREAAGHGHRNKEGSQYRSLSVRARPEDLRRWAPPRVLRAQRHGVRGSRDEPRLPGVRPRSSRQEPTLITTQWAMRQGPDGGLRLPVRGQFEPLLGLRTSLLCSLTSAAGRSALVRSILASPSLVVPLGVRVSERRAVLKCVGRSAKHRCQLRGASPCVSYRALSCGSLSFDSLGVHRGSNDRTSIPKWRGLSHSTAIGLSK